MEVKDWLQKNGVLLAGLGVIGAGFVFNGGDLQQYQANGQHIKQQRLINSRNFQELTVNQEAAKDLAKIANDRYCQGVTFVFAQDGRGAATAISTGKPVLDFARKVPLSDGVLVGDVFGGTGVIEGGVVAKFAFTGNKALVTDAMQNKQGGNQACQTQPE